MSVHRMLTRSVRSARHVVMARDYEAANDAQSRAATRAFVLAHLRWLAATAAALAALLVEVFRAGVA